jgi:hypothetical protein
MTSNALTEQMFSGFTPKAYGPTPIARRVEIGQGIVIQASNYELSDDEWGTIRPMLPDKARGVPRVDDRRVLNRILWLLRSGAPWRDLPTFFGPFTTCYSSFCSLAKG